MSSKREVEVENLFQIIKDRYGQRLTREELDEVKRALETNFDTALSMRVIELKNSDEPFTIFKPIRGRSK
jgi:hypothetical protein